MFFLAIQNNTTTRSHCALNSISKPSTNNNNINKHSDLLTIAPMPPGAPDIPGGPGGPYERQ